MTDKERMNKYREKRKRLKTELANHKGFMKATEENEQLCAIIAMEECAELTQAISKGIRGKLNADNMAEEIADVLIGIEWIKEIYGIDTLEIQKWIDFKQNRIEKRLKNGTFK